MLPADSVKRHFLKVASKYKARLTVDGNEVHSDPAVSYYEMEGPMFLRMRLIRASF